MEIDLDKMELCAKQGAHMEREHLLALIAMARRYQRAEAKCPGCDPAEGFCRDCREAEQQRCTCPSGDGSLRWPCPVHPPESAPPVEPSTEKVDDLETALFMFDMGLSFALCHSGIGATREAIKKLQSDFTVICEAIAAFRRTSEDQKAKAYQNGIEDGQLIAASRRIAEDARMADFETRYKDLLQQLGVQGHDGATAEIANLRAAAKVNWKE